MRGIQYTYDIVCVHVYNIHATCVHVCAYMSVCVCIWTCVCVCVHICVFQMIKAPLDSTPLQKAYTLFLDL